MMQDDNESAENKNQQNQNESNMLESEDASPIGNHSDPGDRQLAASGPDSSDNELMEINQQLPNNKMHQKENLFDNDEDEYEDKQ
jgi:hypothetical protein